MTRARAQAVGVFDSGVGGLTILDACLDALPAEDFIYFGDSAFFPYGGRGDDELRRRALAIGRWLDAQRVKLVVVACNTASAVALGLLQRELAAPVVGVIDTEVQAAVRATRNRRIGLLATEATVRSDSYPRMIHAQDAGVQVTSVACPRLAPVIQEGAPIDRAAETLVAGCSAPLLAAGVDTVILGCTHFPVVEEVLRRAMPNVNLIDGRTGVALEVAATLDRAGLRRPAGREGARRITCSGDPEAFRRLAQRFLRAPLGPVEAIDPASWSD